ncbi:MAG TPA: 3-dehydroquinate synthase [Candidatus Azoamicus sp.]
MHYNFFIKKNYIILNKAKYMKNITMYKIIKQTFDVKYNYNIFFTKDIFNLNNKILIKELNKINLQQKKILIIIDKNIIKFHKNLIENINNYFNFYKDSIKLVSNPIIFTGGEKIKNHYLIVKYFYKLIEKYKICRQSFLIAIGGGTIQDLAGYISSTAHRGIKLIRIPTTVLSQDDSGVGVKNGINFCKKKNFIGCFSTPYSVINDFSFLKSLNLKQIMEGISEAIKVALIKDKEFFKYIENNSENITEPAILENLIYRCAKLHAEHISKYGDPFEKTSSRPLDFGHWIAHKLESMSKYKISHGEAVGIGIIIDATYSYLIKLLKKNKWKKIINCMIKLKMNIFSDLLLKKEKEFLIFKGLEEFREHLGGKLTITLLKNIGTKIDVHHVNTNMYLKAIKFIQKINKSIIKHDKQI